jgi:hypothetical protein
MENKITCKICGFETNLIGINPHLKQKHNILKDEYIKNYGEYRIKELSIKNRSEKSNIECKICNKNVASERHLSYHLKMNHDINKKDYIIKYLLNNNIPKCKCGCGEFVNIRDRGQSPYWSDYKSGHNTQNSHLGLSRSDESKLKMRESAIKRLQEKNSVFYRSTSNDEIQFREWVKSFYDGEIIYNDTKILSGLELDLYIPEYNLAIELNGIRFHSDLYKKKNYHVKKTKECNNLGIKLIHIWLPDWYNSKEIIKSQIKNFLFKIDNKIYARDCEIKIVGAKESSIFLDKNHLQKNVVSKIRYALYYKNELVQVMTFGKLRKLSGRKSKENQYELLRLCSKTYTVIIGGASKLFKYFIKQQNPELIMSFANRDWSIGNVYEKLNMKLIGYTEPGYFYSNGKNKQSRYKCQKHILVNMGFDSSKSEYEIMTDRGYYRVWDTGNLIYEWNKI